MPRVTPAHEQEVRDRIVRAALATFEELGFHRATVQDVVQRSGLSVGAIYTYFKGKDDLFLACCDIAASRGFAEVADRLARGRTTADRLAIAIGTYLDTLDPAVETGPGSVTYLAQAWAEARQSPIAREMLARRREQLGTIGQLLLREGIGRGELPPWLDPEATARSFTALLDGLLLQRIEAGDAWRREDAERTAFAVLELALAATAAPARPDVAAPPARSFVATTPIERRLVS